MSQPKLSIVTTALASLLRKLTQYSVYLYLERMGMLQILPQFTSYHPGCSQLRAQYYSSSCEDIFKE